LNQAVSVVAIVVAACSLFITAIATRRKAEGDYTSQLEKRISQLEKQNEVQQRDLDACKAARDGFEDRNFQLLQEAYENRKEIDELRKRVDRL